LEMGGIAPRTILVEFTGGYPDRVLEISNLGKAQVEREKDARRKK